MIPRCWTGGAAVRGLMDRIICNLMGANLSGGSQGPFIHFTTRYSFLKWSMEPYSEVDSHLFLGSLSDDSDYDSLFDADEEITHRDHALSNSNMQERPAQRSPPPIPGLYLNPSICLPEDFAESLWKSCMEIFFNNSDINQVMLFERARSSQFSESEITMENSGLEESQSSRIPKFLLVLLDELRDLLGSVVPAHVHTLLFPRDDEGHHARQAILNHYRPGEGITPHVDLLNRYGDGIIGVSLHGGTVMDFMKVQNECDQSEEAPVDPQSYSVYLPERSIFVISDEARYAWTHGISRRTEDVVEAIDGNSVELIPRGERLSITFRWLLPGADVVGE